MQPERLPLLKLVDAPFISLDETNIEMASLVFLFVAVLLIAHIRWRRQWVRMVVQLASFFVFYFVVYSCLGVFGMIRNGLYGVTLIGTAYSESFYWLALPVVVIAVTLFEGSVFCGWICPTGTIQSLAAKLKRLVVPKRLSGTKTSLALLGLFLVTFLVLTTWLAERKHMFVEDSSLHWVSALLLLGYLVVLGVIDDLPTRRLRVLSVLAIAVTALSHMTITSPVHFAFTSRDDPASALSTLVIVLSAMVIPRSWCRYLCPWGFVMGYLHRLSRLKIERNPAVCRECRTCADVCEVDAVVRGVVRHEHCQFCHACVDACPAGALAIVDVWRKSAANDALVRVPVPPAKPRLQS